MRLTQRILSVFWIASLVFVGVSGLLSHASAQPAPQGFGTEGGIQTGTVVQVSEEDAKKVEPATQANLEKMYGVVVDPSSLPITIADPDKPNQEYVATSGNYSVIVTDESGPISNGDNVTLSSLNGTAMKATFDQEIILGRALAGFDGQSNTIGSVNLKDVDGNPIKTVNIGLIPVAIEIKPNPEVQSTKTRLPNFLERIGLEIAQKPLSPFRLYMAASIAAITVIIAIIVLYSGVRSSVISLGRNPLNKKTIFRALLEVVLTGFIILIIGVFAVYLLLKL